MDFVGAIQSCFSKYVTFSGRAARSEYWYWALFLFLGTMACSIIDDAIFGNPKHGMFGALFSLATFLPSLSVFVRRLHDVNRSGWWYWIAFTIIGLFFPLLVWACTKGTEGDNRFGPDPLV